MKRIRPRYAVAGVAALLISIGLGAPLWQYFPGYNLRIVEPGVFYGARQMGGPAMERYIDALGLKTVLNMRGENAGTPWYDDEVAACRKKGIAHVDFGWSRNDIPSPDSLRAYLDVLDKGQPPFLAHCQGGTHRTGLAAAVFLLNRGRSIPEARGEFGPMFKDAPIGDVVALYEGSPLLFRAWVEQEYPAKYAAWEAQKKDREKAAGK